MPPFENRTAPQILREIIARIVARSSLDDVLEGSKINTIAASFAEEVAGEEQRLKTIRDSFSFLNVVGADLDDRAADLPPDGLGRLPATNASGGALSLRRDVAGAVLTVFAGSLYGRKDDGALVYRQIADQVFGVGDLLIENVAVECLTPGSVGNCIEGQINRIVAAPNDLASAINTLRITNGDEEETDAQFKARCLSYLSSLTGTTPDAIEFAALSYVAESGVRVRFARIFEDPEQPGYSELLLDDGGGLLGYDRPGETISGVVPDGGPPRLYHEAPALTTPTLLQYTRGVDTFTLSPDQFVGIPERGLIHVKAGVLEPGDVWSAGKYQVFEGLPKEIQELIEGSSSDGVNEPGWRAAGCRVRVVKPSVYYVEMKVNVVPRTGFDFDDIAAQTKNAIIEYVATLGPGETLYNARLVDRIMDNEGVLTVRLYVGAVEDNSPLPDYSPITPRHVIRTTDAKIEIVTFPEVF